MAKVSAIRDVAKFVAVPRSFRATTAMQLLGGILGAGLGLAGCAPVGTAPPGQTNAQIPNLQIPNAQAPNGQMPSGQVPDAQVMVAPGVTFALPSPATLGRSVEAQQLVTARYRNDTFAFEASISVTPARLLLVGTDMLGRRAMTIEWTGNDLTFEAAPWLPAELRARNIIADIMLAHWPQNAVRAGLAPAHALQQADPGHRAIVVDGRDMIRIDREDGAAGSWSGRWLYRNLGWGYQLDIQSAEAAP